MLSAAATTWDGLKAPEFYRYAPMSSAPFMPSTYANFDHPGSGNVGSMPTSPGDSLVTRYVQDHGLSSIDIGPGKTSEDIKDVRHMLAKCYVSCGKEMVSTLVLGHLFRNLERPILAHC